MPAYTFQRSLLYSEADASLVRNATGGQFLSNEGVAQQLYDLVDTPIAELTSGADGVVPPFKADIATGVVSFGATALPVISVEAQAAGLDAVGAVADAAAARAAAESAQLAAQAAADNTSGVTDAAADAAIDRAEAEGRLAGVPVLEAQLALEVQDKLNRTGSDPSAVKLTGNQVVDGTKTFTAPPVVPPAAFGQDRVSGLVTALAGKAALASAFVVVNAGANAATARPAGVGAVYWICNAGVSPTNKVTGDLVFTASA